MTNQLKLLNLFKSFWGHFKVQLHQVSTSVHQYSMEKNIAYPPMCISLNVITE